MKKGELCRRYQYFTKTPNCQLKYTGSLFKAFIKSLVEILHRGLIILPAQQQYSQVTLQI